MRNLTWSTPGESLDQRDIDDAENILNIKFPEEYVRLVSAHSGGLNPDECEFPYLQDVEEQIGGFGELMSLRKEKSNNVFEAIESFNIDQQLPEGVIPVIDTGSGDCICHDYRTSETPLVVYFDHGQSTYEESIVFVADTFASFLNLLQVPDEDEED